MNIEEKRRFECISCRECPTEDEWNTHNQLAIITFGFPPISEAKDEHDDGASYDCPSCEERNMVSDMLEV